MGDIGELYKVVSFLIGRPAYTHELAHYRKQVSLALIHCHPELPDRAPNGTWKTVRDNFIDKWGEEITLGPSLKDVLADDRNPIETLIEMGVNPNSIHTI